MKAFSRILPVALLLLSAFFAAVRGEEPPAPMSFEDVTRENTVDAYMGFIQANPDSKETEEAYKLAKDAIPNEIKLTNSLAPAGQMDCGYSRTQDEALKSYNACGSIAPPYLCTAHKQTQVIENTTRHTLAFLDYTKLSEQHWVYEATFIAPGAKFKKAVDVRGVECKGPAYAGRGEKCKGIFTCSKKPEIDAKKPLVDLFPVPADLATGYQEVFKNHDPKGARQLMKAHPHSPLKRSLDSYLKPWLEEADARLKKEVAFSVAYTKKFSPAFPNPYELAAKNTGKAPVQAVVSLESERNMFLLTLAPGEEKKVAGVSEKGKEASYKVHSLSLEIIPIPTLLLATESSPGKEKKPCLLLLELTFDGTTLTGMNGIAGRYYYVDHAYNGKYNSLGTLEISDFDAEVQAEGPTFEIDLNPKAEKGDRRDTIRLAWKEGAWTMNRWGITVPEPSVASEVKGLAEPKVEEKSQGNRRR